MQFSKPLLGRGNQAKHSGWAKKYQDFTLDDRKKVLFTDESEPEIYGSDIWDYVADKQGEEQCFLNERFYYSMSCKPLKLDFFLTYPTSHNQIWKSFIIFQSKFLQIKCVHQISL